MLLHFTCNLHLSNTEKRKQNTKTKDKLKNHTTLLSVYMYIPLYIPVFILHTAEPKIKERKTRKKGYLFYVNMCT